MERIFDTAYCPVEAVRLQRFGRSDPTMALEDGGVWRVMRTPEGPATLHLSPGEGVVRAQAWGGGAAWALERAPLMCGSGDDPNALEPLHPRLIDAVRRCPKLCLGRAPRLFDTLVAYVLQQRVAFADAAASWRRIMQRHAELAPGPSGIRLPLSPAQWRALSRA